MKLKMMKMAIATTVAMNIGGYAFGAGRQSFSLSDAGAQQDAAHVVKKVKGKGFGANKVEALKDAYRDAVERAVGMYVDAEQMMKNEELVKDQILTQSNAYIEKCEVVKENTRPNGFVEIQIIADVKTSALTRKISDVMPKQTFTLGNEAQNFHSQDLTKEKRNVDAAALMQNVLDGLNPVKQLITLSLASPKAMRYSDGSSGRGRSRSSSSSDGNGKIYYRFKFTVNEQKYYNEFLPPILKVLDQVSLNPPKDLRLTASTKGFDESTVEGTQNYIEGKWDERVRGNRPVQIIGDYGHTKSYDSSLTGAYVGMVRYVDAQNRSWLFSTHIGSGSISDLPVVGRNSFDTIMDEKRSGEKCKFFRVLAITKMNASRTIVKAREYVLSRECAIAVLKWQRGLLTKKRGGSEDSLATSYNVVFTDKDGDEVAAKAVSFNNDTIINTFFTNDLHQDYGGWDSNKYIWHITPLIHGDAASLEEWIGFDIPQDDLPNIKSVTVELAE